MIFWHWTDTFVFGFAGHGPCGKGKVGPSGAKNQLIRVPHCRWGFYIVFLESLLLSTIRSFDQEL